MLFRMYVHCLQAILAYCLVQEWAMLFWTKLKCYYIEVSLSKWKQSCSHMGNWIQGLRMNSISIIGHFEHITN